MAVYICLRLSECMNPFLYNMASTKMRRASVRALGRIFYCMCRYEWKTWKRQETNSENNRTERSITNCTTTGTASLLSGVERTSHFTYNLQCTLLYTV